MKRVLDDHNRCAVCGRTSTEKCNEMIHKAHDADWQQVLSYEGLRFNQMQPLAKRVLKNAWANLYI